MSQSQSQYFYGISQDTILNKLTFGIKDVDVGIVNALRRVIMSYLPTYAVGFDPYNREQNDIVFHKNSTTLHNEILGHRISMIPLHLRPDDPAKYRFEIKLVNTTHETIVISTNDIKCSVEIAPDTYTELPDSSTLTIFPLDKITGDPIIITKLKPREELHVVFKPRKGCGFQNACWSPVSLSSYTFVVDEQKAEIALQEKLKEIGNADTERQANYRKVFETLDKHRYFYTNEYGEPINYEFKIEVENGSDPIDLISSGLKWLEDRLQKLSPQIKQIEDGFHLLTFEDAEHTIGNLLQTMFFKNYVRGTKEVVYVGYNVPHPLEKIMIMKMKINEGLDLEELLEVAFKSFQKEIADIRNDWELSTSTYRGKTVSQHLVVPKRKSNFVLPVDVETETPQPPTRKPRAKKATEKASDASGDEETETPKPPTRKPRAKKATEKASDASGDEETETPKPPTRKPRAKKATEKASDANGDDETETPKPPTRKPRAKKTDADK